MEYTIGREQRSRLHYINAVLYCPYPGMEACTLDAPQAAAQPESWITSIPYQRTYAMSRSPLEHRARVVSRLRCSVNTVIIGSPINAKCLLTSIRIFGLLAYGNPYWLFSRT